VLTLNIKENVALRAQVVLMSEEMKKLNADLEKLKAELTALHSPVDPA
jgi:dynactin complex subunit